MKIQASINMKFVLKSLKQRVYLYLNPLYAKFCTRMVSRRRSVEFRGAFMANILQYPRDFSVWIDERGSDHRDALCKFGYALRGLPAVCKRLLVRGE